MGKDLFALQRKKAIKIAKELYYSKEAVEKLKTAKTASEINQILINARKEKYGASDIYSL